MSLTWQHMRLLPAGFVLGSSRRIPYRHERCVPVTVLFSHALPRSGTFMQRLPLPHHDRPYLQSFILPVPAGKLPPALTLHFRLRRQVLLFRAMSSTMYRECSGSVAMFMYLRYVPVGVPVGWKYSRSIRCDDVAGFCKSPPPVRCQQHPRCSSLLCLRFFFPMVLHQTLGSHTISRAGLDRIVIRRQISKSSSPRR